MLLPAGSIRSRSEEILLGKHHKLKIRPPLCVLQLAVLQEEWKARSLSSQLMTGTELAESSTTDGFQHPRIRSEPAASLQVLDVGPILKPFVSALLLKVPVDPHAAGEGADIRALQEAGLPPP